MNFSDFKVLRVSSAATNNASAQTTGTDTKGCNSVAMLFNVPAIDIAFTLLKVQYSTDNSSWSDLSGASFTTLPSGSDDGKTWMVFIPKSQYRYYRWSYTVGNGTTNTQVAVVLGCNNVEGPLTDADRGGISGSVLFA